MQVFEFVLDCLDFLKVTLTLFLLRYAIRLVGWLKHCDRFLSLSLSMSVLSADMKALALNSGLSKISSCQSEEEHVCIDQTVAINLYNQSDAGFVESRIVVIRAPPRDSS